MSGLATAIHQAAIDSGFDNCGIIPPSMMTGFDERMAERMRNVPESAPFYEGFRQRFTDVIGHYPWAKSVIVCLFDYGKYRYPKEMQGHYAKAFFLSPEDGKTDGYDQSKFERSLTELGIRWEHADVSLRYAAMMAGLGIIRKNNFLYTEHGSYVSLRSYVADCECQLIHEPQIRACSEKCDLCRRACRTHALSDAYTINPLKCVSFWTTFGKGQVPPFLSEEMYEEWLCGCDNCQDACPHNRRHKWDEGEKFSELDELAPEITPQRLLEKSDEYIREHVIAKTEHHLEPEDVPVLRMNAERALRFEENKM